jgi:prepilin-type N-terminal cleavage/methylation domain-containing protein
MNHIKTNNKRARQRGTTLIELSVVIAVILLLVGVLFIGVQAWRNSANKAACLVNISSIQKAARGYQNAHLLNPTDALPHASLVTDQYFTTLPTCPVSTNTYTFTDTVPDIGAAYASCSDVAGHGPANLNNW